jgi:hypothetical protein
LDSLVSLSIYQRCPLSSTVAIEFNEEPAYPRNKASVETGEFHFRETQWSTDVLKACVSSQKDKATPVQSSNERRGTGMKKILLAILLYMYVYRKDS